MNGEFRLRVAYAKQGRGGWLSHLEVLRAVERTVRRSGLPYAVTQGFHPHIKLAFGPALPVGTSSANEFFDLYLTAFVEPSEAFRALAAAAPPVVPVGAVGYVGAAEPSLSAALTWADYRAEVFGATITATQVAEAFAALRSRETLDVVQKGKAKVFDTARSIPKDAVVSPQSDTLVIQFSLRIDPAGSLRPDALIRALFDGVSADYSHLRIERTALFAEDGETGALVRPL